MGRNDSKIASGVARAGNAIGNGLVAGLVATAAMTLAQMIEMKVTGRKPSTTPAEAATKVLHIRPARTKKGEKEKFAQGVHWIYGTSWGIARGLFALAGLKGWPATLVHFGAVWGTALVMLPSLKVSSPVYKWDAKTITHDFIHHALYASAAGLVYDAIGERRKNGKTC